jgi:MoaA/NifB/PqqE/SkfB family radical SAM enzyme
MFQFALFRRLKLGHSAYPGIARLWNGSSARLRTASSVVGTAAEVVVPLPPPAGPFEGEVVELSLLHAHGWVRDLSEPTRRVGCRAVLSDTGETVGQGQANQFKHGLAAGGIGDGAHAFWFLFDRKLSELEQDKVQIQVLDGEHTLKIPTYVVRDYEPLLHVAMDIVDNCNLRCPFCLYDYSKTRATHTMTTEMLTAALRFLPYTRDGEFWLSCLHEPTLHPDLIEFVEQVPHEYRRKLFFTSNLAKRMPTSYFDWLASNGMHHINVSIESRNPEIYERMRKGARHRIFQENWDKFIAALDASPKPTQVRYIMMAYKANLREIPDLVRYLINERRAWQVEIRYTFDLPFIPAEFRTSEFLDGSDWNWLSEELKEFPTSQVQLITPPGGGLEADLTASDGPVGMTDDADAVPDDDILPGRYMFRLSWDGTLKVVGVLASSRHDSAMERVLVEQNISDIQDPAVFLDGLMHGT